MINNQIRDMVNRIKTKKEINNTLIINSEKFKFLIIIKNDNNYIKLYDF